MNYTTYAENFNDLNIIKESGLKEVIISSQSLSRLSKTKDEELTQLCTRAKELQLKVILEWDILIVENQFSKIQKFFSEIPNHLYDVVRVQDVGVLHYILENSGHKIQLILETGNHNLTGIKKWKEVIGERLDRLVLSIELNQEKLKSYIAELDCDIELLTLGRILIFYTPRNLLSTSKQSFHQDLVEASGESEESPHKGFPLIENRHGTFMFHVKDLCLLDKFEELIGMNLSFARVDLRFNDLNLLLDIVNCKSNEDGLLVKKKYGLDVIRGYFQTNKSDVLFKKLKNYRIQRKDESYVGEVLEAQKSEFMAIHVKTNRSLKLNDKLKFITPEGKEHSCLVHVLKNSALEDIAETNKDQLALINYMSGVWTKSQVYFE